MIALSDWLQAVTHLPNYGDEGFLSTQYSKNKYLHKGIIRPFIYYEMKATSSKEIKVWTAVCPRPLKWYVSSFSSTLCHDNNGDNNNNDNFSP